MRKKTFSTAAGRSLSSLAGVTSLLLLSGGVLRGQEKLIYSPTGSGDVAPFVTATDASGNLFGADWFGGTDYGSVFELSPQPSGVWTETGLYTFNGPPDGQQPLGVIRDSAGNLYGTTLYGGAYQNNDCVLLASARPGSGSPNGADPLSASGFNCGTVFELSPNGNGAWTETILYNFMGGNDGANPQGGLVFDLAGNLCGTTSNGGANKVGVVFELSPMNGVWTETVLHSFGGASDGAFPNGNLAMDKAGNLYGTTASGNTGTAYQNGIVFELAPSGGMWKETVLHQFAAQSDGKAPFAGVVLDAAGNLYGTTSAGGAGGGGCPGFGCGTVYELHHSQAGGWREVILYNFPGAPGASSPDFGVTLDSSGNLYGAAGGGNAGSCQLFGPCGTVFKLTHSGNRWQATVLHNFAGSPGDGNQTDSGVIFGWGGRLYGGTEYGGSATCTNGSSGCGAVYEVKP